MQILLAGVDGKRVSYEVEPSDTILSFKRKIREKEGYSVMQIRLIYGGKTLNNDRTWLDYKIKKLSTVDLIFHFGGGFYCPGCMLPKLIYLSANISLNCYEDLSFDDVQLLHSIKEQFNKLNNGTKETIMNCVETCGVEWNQIENEDANYFQDYQNRRRSQAISQFVGTIGIMLHPYISKYRASKMIENMKNSNISMRLYESNVTTSTNIDWLTVLHNTRCPICCCRFSDVQLEINVHNRMPMSLCSVSNKHIVCYDCCQRLRLCPLCDGALVTNMSCSRSTIDAIKNARKNLENYCFPSDLVKEITIEYNQQPIAHGAMGQLFLVKDIYAVKCALIANTIDTEEALTHEIAVSRPLSHIPQLVTVYGSVRLPKYGIGIVMEYINGPSLAAALSDSSTIIRDLSIKKRLKIALGIAQGIGELHLAKLVHRDFKPENVLLYKSVNGIYTPKIADFGISFQLATASATAVKDSCGTVGYDAPEVVVDNQLPSVASDIYALSFTLHELLTGKRVFSRLKSAQILAKFTMRGERPYDWPSEIPSHRRKIIEKGWSPKPEQRATISEIIHAIRKSIDPNQFSCIEMLRQTNVLRKKIITVQVEDFKSFELYDLNEFLSRISIDDCEAMQMFIKNLPSTL